MNKFKRKAQDIYNKFAYIEITAKPLRPNHDDHAQKMTIECIDQIIDAIDSADIQHPRPNEHDVEFWRKVRDEAEVMLQASWYKVD